LVWGRVYKLVESGFALVQIVSFRDNARHNFSELLERQELGGLPTEDGKKRRALFSDWRREHMSLSRLMAKAARAPI